MRLEESWGLLAMKFDDNELYSIPSSVNGTQCSLHNLAKWKNGLAFKKINFSDEGVPVIKIAELNNGIGPTTAYTKEIFSEDVHLKRGDLLFSWSGNPQTSIDTFRFDLEEGWLNQHIFKVTPNEELVDFDYFYFLMKNLKPYFTKIATNKQTTGLGHVTLADIKRMNLIVPDVETQKRIVSVIKPIDDKIKLNNDINNNLEQQAQAIFLKMFPDIFSASASSSFQNLIEFSNGKKRPETIGNIPVYGGNGVLAYTNQSNAENCVIIGRVGAYCGNTFLCPEKCWTSDNAIQAKSKNEDSPLFIYYLLRNASLPSRHIGTGQPLMTQAILNAIPVNEPSTQEIRSFINICTPLHETIFANEKQNISLALLRDTLLPKLMSGELDVSDIDL